MKKRIINIGLITAFICFVICFLIIKNRESSPKEIVKISELLSQESEEVKDSSVTDSEKDTHNVASKYDIDKRIEQESVVTVKQYNEVDGSVVCEIKAPDIYSYVMDNIDTIYAQTEDETYEYIVSYLESRDYKLRTVEITVNAAMQDDKYIIDDMSFEFQDAIHGGLDTLMTELVIIGLQEESVEEN